MAFPRENPLFRNVHNWQFSGRWVFSDQALCKEMSDYKRSRGSGVKQDSLQATTLLSLTLSNALVNWQWTQKSAVLWGLKSTSYNIIEEFYTILYMTITGHMNYVFVFIYFYLLHDYPWPQIKILLNNFQKFIFISLWCAIMKNGDWQRTAYANGIGDLMKERIQTQHS